MLIHFHHLYSNMRRAKFWPIVSCTPVIFFSPTEYRVWIELICHEIFSFAAGQTISWTFWIQDKQRSVEFFCQKAFNFLLLCYLFPTFIFHCVRQHESNSGLKDNLGNFCRDKINLIKKKLIWRVCRLGRELMCPIPTVSNLDFKVSNPILTVNPVFLIIFDSCEVSFAPPSQFDTVGVWHVCTVIFLAQSWSLFQIDFSFFLEDWGLFRVCQTEEEETTPSETDDGVRRRFSGQTGNGKVR